MSRGDHSLCSHLDLPLHKSHQIDLDETCRGRHVTRRKHDVTVDVTKYQQFLSFIFRRSPTLNQWFSFLPVAPCRPRSASFLLFLFPRPSRPSAGLDGRLKATSKLIPTYRKRWRNDCPPTTEPNVGLAPAGLGLGEVLGGGAVHAVMRADGTGQPLADDVPLDVVETGASGDRNEGVLQRQRLQYRLIDEQQLGNSLMEDERLVRRIDDSRQIDTDQQNLSCSHLQATIKQNI